MEQFEAVEVDTDTDTPPPPPAYETIIVQYTEYSAFICAARELNRVLSCELYGTYEDNDTVRWKIRICAYMIEFEDEEDIENYNEIVLNTKKRRFICS